MKFKIDYSHQDIFINELLNNNKVVNIAIKHRQTGKTNILNKLMNIYKDKKILFIGFNSINFNLLKKYPNTNFIYYNSNSDYNKLLGKNYDIILIDDLEFYNDNNINNIIDYLKINFQFIEKVILTLSIKDNNNLKFKKITELYNNDYNLSIDTFNILKDTNLNNLISNFVEFSETEKFIKNQLFRKKLKNIVNR